MNSPLLLPRRLKRSPRLLR